MDSKYIEIDGKPVVEPDLMTWARWLETADRTVEKTEIGEQRVSTVFLGLDHSFGNGEPLLYETMVFDGPMDGEQDRYPTRELAKEGHRLIVLRVAELGR